MGEKKGHVKSCFFKSAMPHEYNNYGTEPENKGVRPKAPVKAGKEQRVKIPPLNK